MSEDVAFPGWSTVLLDQLEWHWRHQARPRPLTDEEHRWEPGARLLERPPPRREPATRGHGRRHGCGHDRLRVRDAGPGPRDHDRLAARPRRRRCARRPEHRYFGGPPRDWDTYAYPLTAAAALADLDAAHARWVAGVRSLDEDALRAPCREEGHEQDPMAGLVLHIHRELIHHLAEVALLRDLWAHRVA